MERAVYLGLDIFFRGLEYALLLFYLLLQALDAITHILDRGALRRELYMKRQQEQQGEYRFYFVHRRTAIVLGVSEGWKFLFFRMPICLLCG